MPVYEDPYPGWTSNIYGPVGIMFAIGMGVMRTLLCDVNLDSDMVPVDYCINSLICAAWENYNQRTYNEQMKVKTEIPVYNYSSGPDRHITWSTHIEYSKQYKYPLKDALWATFVLEAKNKYIYTFLWFLLHTIPAYAIDLYLILSGQKPKMIATYKKLDKFLKVLSYFSTSEWKIINQNVKRLWSKLNENDQKLFPFNMDVVDHKKLVFDACTGIKLYIMKEGLDNVERDIKRYQRLVLLHNVIKYSLLISVLFILFLKFFM